MISSSQRLELMSSEFSEERSVRLFVPSVYDMLMIQKSFLCSTGGSNATLVMNMTIAVGWTKRYGGR